jgi:hypothetical protein
MDRLKADKNTVVWRSPQEGEIWATGRSHEILGNNVDEEAVGQAKSMVNLQPPEGRRNSLRSRKRQRIE